MIQGSGLPVFPGVAIGNGVVYRKAQRQAAVSSGDPKQEQEKFDQACATAKEQLSALYEKAVKELGAEKAAIVEVQMLMLEDLDYLEAVAAEIAAGTPAATAASECGEGIAQVFAGLDDAYMQARAADIRDVSQRVADILCGADGFRLPEGEFLLIAEDSPESGFWPSSPGRVLPAATPPFWPGR